MFVLFIVEIDYLTQKYNNRFFFFGKKIFSILYSIGIIIYFNKRNKLLKKKKIYFLLRNSDNQIKYLS